MSGSNTENDNQSFGNPKRTLLNTTVGEHCNEELLYPVDELEKWKGKLEFLRSRMDDTIGRHHHSPLRRPANGEPLHKVFKNIMNRDSFRVSVDENVDRANVISKRPDRVVDDSSSPKGTARNEARPTATANQTSAAGKTRRTKSRAENKTGSVGGRKTDGGPPRSGHEPSRAKKTGEMNAKQASGRRAGRSGPRKGLETRTDVASSTDARSRSSKRRTIIRKTAVVADVSSSKQNK